MLRDDLTTEAAPWYSSDWLDHTINSAHLAFDDAFERWRTLFRATRQQMDLAHAIQMNAAADERTRREAKQRYDEAQTQRDLLLDTRASMNSDFYAYRYLASEGFLPGYNFPRLPLLAYIPARRERIGRDSFPVPPSFPWPIRIRPALDHLPRRAAPIGLGRPSSRFETPIAYQHHRACRSAVPASARLWLWSF